MKTSLRPTLLLGIYDNYDRLPPKLYNRKTADRQIARGEIPQRSLPDMLSIGDAPRGLERATLPAWRASSHDAAIRGKRYHTVAQSNR
jgi:hypothetical protein